MTYVALLFVLPVTTPSEVPSWRKRQCQRRRQWDFRRYQSFSGCV